ncbi:hypothetical protein SAMN05660420_00091 [Desulfuromusa kysingii]|uniref:Excinuclease ABC subunit A n=1 Tax=Desulfuromusa kysingii TaxID=37625 RepID=A0A1H3VIN5_9BACT|nr:hypothetical protein [Desulfuromusa kysingii]SDZ74663.1 hypothetical protein SAMN05660420_00091 [Desulfuromusa kysingii]
MRTLFVTILATMICFGTLVAQTQAADNWYKFSAQEAMDSSLGNDKLRPEIRLYMKGQKHPGIVKKMGEYKANKRTNGFGKSAQQVCERAFISALMALQDRAVREGGNAVIDIYTITKNIEFESATEYSCIKGGVVGNVALMGTVAKIK